jgi:hypothetical protein
VDDDDTYTALVMDERDLAFAGNVGVTQALSQGKVLVPLAEATWDCIGEALASTHPEEAGEHGYFMSAILRCAGFGEEFPGTVAFLEVQAERQFAIVASNGTVTASFLWDLSEDGSPIGRGEGPVNAALRAVGVVRGELPDECMEFGSSFDLA